MPTPTTALAAWRDRLGLSQRAAADALGMTLSGYQQLEHERSAVTGERRAPRRVVLLAAAAIESGLSPIDISGKS